MNITELKSKIAALKIVDDEAAALLPMQEKAAADLAEFSANCNLASEKDLLKVAQMQVLATLLPARIAAFEDKLAQAMVELREAGWEFITSELFPKMQAVRKAAQTKVKKAIAEHFSNEAQLSAAVDESDLVSSIDAIFCTKQQTEFDNPRQAIRYSNQVTESWQQITKIEKTI